MLGWDAEAARWKPFLLELNKSPDQIHAVTQQHTAVVLAALEDSLDWPPTQLDLDRYASQCAGKCDSGEVERCTHHLHRMAREAKYLGGLYDRLE